MIRFPKMHVAKSTVNRILNVADEINAGRMAAATIDIPSLPSEDPKGKALDIATNTPVDPVAAPPGIGAEQVLGPNSIL